MSRDLFARHALQQVPRILTLLDRNAHSPTYGCFDRNYWHYKILDFPSGMSQEFVWPLALAYETALEGNPYHGQPVVREWAHAGMRFAARSAHRDGSCDDYFPYERAGGAAAFALLACVESYTLLQLEDEELLRFFERRASWLAGHQESARLTNHQALIVLCLELLGRRLSTDRWRRARDARLAQVLSWQSAEGWFREYEGCDPGYHTLTISCLARVLELAPDDERLREALRRAVRVAAQFVHPDGSYGGEYGSRNTYNFFPHGFELVGRWMPEALGINDAVLRAAGAGRLPAYEEDHLVGHHAWNYLLAWRDFVPEARRPAPAPRPEGRVHLEEAGLLIDRRAGTELYLATNKGGVFKLFRDGALVASDTQLSLRVGRGARERTAVAHLVAPYRVELRGGDEIAVAGRLGWAKRARMTPLRLIALRLASLTVGRFFPNLLRRLLQRLLIVGKDDAPFTFSRRLRWHDGRWHVSDELRAERGWDDVTGAGIAPDQTSIYVVMSRVFQLGQLRPWLDLTPAVRVLAPGEALRVERAP